MASWWPSPSRKAAAKTGRYPVFEVATGKSLADTDPAGQRGYGRSGSVAWNGDASGFWYTRYPRAGERARGSLNFYQQIYFHRLGCASCARMNTLWARASRELPRSNSNRPTTGSS